MTIKQMRIDFCSSCHDYRHSIAKFGCGEAQSGEGSSRRDAGITTVGSKEKEPSQIIDLESVANTMASILA